MPDTYDSEVFGRPKVRVKDRPKPRTVQIRCTACKGPEAGRFFATTDSIERGQPKCDLHGG